MQVFRYTSVWDLGVVTVVAVALFLPAREMYASAAAKGDDSAQFQLALAEARTMADPGDGAKVEELARRLSDAQFQDWAVDAAVRGERRAAASPTHWRALLATSLAYVDRKEVKDALRYATLALTACQGTRETCPNFEETRMQIYHDHLEAGVSSGIDPRADPKGFREASQGQIRTIRLTKPAQNQGSGTPAP